jgi:hypothetical protein
MSAPIRRLRRQGSTTTRLQLSSEVTEEYARRNWLEPRRHAIGAVAEDVPRDDVRELDSSN